MSHDRRSNDGRTGRKADELAAGPDGATGGRLTRRLLLQSTAAAALTAGYAGRAYAAAQPGTLLILGGTGFIGPHLTEQALARGWKVTHFNRGKRKPEGIAGVEHLSGDRDGRLDALKGRTWDAVIDNSGYVPRIVRMSAELLAPNVGQYLFVSSISAYASFAKPNDEDSPLARLPDETVEKIDGETYGGLKVLCEKAAQAAFPGRAIIVRPGYIVGPLDPTDRFTYWPVRVAKGGEMLAPGAPPDPVQVIDARDLAAWMLGLVERKAFGVYNAVSPPRMFTIGGVIDTSRKVTGADTTITWVPADFLARLLTGQEALPPWEDANGPQAGGSLTNVDRALRTGLTIRPLEETIRDTLAWHATRPADRQAKLRAGLAPEREAAILAAWHGTQKADA
jgi:2'-hydroxyisoflavone reductase